MSDVRLWSPTAANNNSTSPDGFPEGMAPSGLNDSAREVMAAIRRQHERAQWIDQGHAPVYVSATQLTISTSPAADLTGIYEPGRRIRVEDANGSLYYATVTSSSYLSPTTTVNLRVDAGGSLPSSPALSKISFGIVGLTNGSQACIDQPVYPFGELSSYAGAAAWTDKRLHVFPITKKPPPGFVVNSFMVRSPQATANFPLKLAIGKIDSFSAYNFTKLSGEASVTVNSSGFFVASLATPYVVNPKDILCIAMISDTGTFTGGALNTIIQPGNPGVALAISMPAEGSAAEGSFAIPSTKAEANFNKYADEPPWVALLSPNYKAFYDAWSGL